MSTLRTTPFVLSSQDADVAETCLLTMYCHALESETDNPILVDDKAVEIARALNPELATAESQLLRKLASGKIDKRLIVFINLRAKRFDQYARDFLARHPNGTIVNLGCGMDSRFLRVDNGQMQFYDLDLPEVIALKKKFFEEKRTLSSAGLLRCGSQVDGPGFGTQQRADPVSGGRAVHVPGSGSG